MLPVLLDLDLVEGGWDGSVRPYPGINVCNFAAQALRTSLLKKFQDDKSPSADAAALEVFLSSNERCRQWSGLPDLTTAEAVAIGEAKDYIYRLFFQNEGYLNSFNLAEISAGFNFGNGANIGSPGTDFFSKIALSTMAATSSTLHYFYMEAISENPTWSSVESTRRCFRETEIVRGSRLSFVPKTRTISRTICTEPTLNKLFLKGFSLRPAVSTLRFSLTRIGNWLG